MDGFETKCVMRINLALLIRIFNIFIMVVILKYIDSVSSNASNTHSNTLFLTLTLLLSETHMDPTTLCGTHFQSGVTCMYFTQ